MRGLATVCGALLALGACNAILGNESEHRLQPKVDPGGGSAGTGARGGSGGTTGATDGGEPPSGGGSGATDGGADVGPSAGAGGEATTGPCVATGAEDCFNGKDDDCNDAVDCEDAACGDATCTPGAELGYFAASMADCKSGYEAVTLHQGLDPGFECTGCTCTPQDAYCDAGVVSHQPAQCGFDTMGLLYNVFSNSCQPVTPGSTTVHYYSIRGFAECTPGGVGVPPTPKWTDTRTYCRLRDVGKGCASGSVCVAKAAVVVAPECSRTNGQHSCSGAFPTSTGDAWSTGFADPRTCQCQCSFGISTCGNAKIQIFNGNNCQGTSHLLGSGTGAEGNDCSLPFTPLSGRIIDGAPATNECPPMGVPIGDVTEDDASTVCCR